MAESIPLFELEFLIILLPPISRGAHLAGPNLHAQRLVELWKIEVDNDVPLEQAFRLLDAEAVAGAILRTEAEDYATDWAQFPTPIERWKDYNVSAFVESISQRHRELSSDPSYDPSAFTFPSLTDLMPELQELCWRALLDGALQAEGVKSARGKIGKIPRAVPPVELVRLRPDWAVSRLCRGEHDEYIDMRVRRAPIQPIKQRWRERFGKTGLGDAMLKVAATYPPGARPAFATVWSELNNQLPGITREQARAAIKDYAPQLRGQRGYRSKT